MGVAREGRNRKLPYAARPSSSRPEFCPSEEGRRLLLPFSQGYWESPSMSAVMDNNCALSLGGLRDYRHAFAYEAEIKSALMDALFKNLTACSPS